MNSWIITGGAGCGKSSVTELLAHHLLKNKDLVFSADRSAQELLDDPAIQEELLRSFGPSALTQQDGRRLADRGWLRAEVFSNPEKRRMLEQILHPGVLRALELMRESRFNAGANVFLAEVPLHYEIGGTVSADLIIVVAASPEVQKRRLMERRGLDESIIEQMLRAQWPIAAKVERADVVIWNDGDRNALEAQVLTLARQYWQA
ncbi:dephospho-CoA kinase [Prosthecobacter fusiformis]|uniref:Dephospho-CoA kinase n=1 Tax=Prosthecobacter fusiformis TaxID=48464 RepID=A0A4R7RT76_9BACT|nr:dephospho-CoA kinase [Prosthecobacter fusiformis]TDU68168.1 dephospho-CoA kinase [Prosthecobacter fusiformis]